MYDKPLPIEAALLYRSAPRPDFTRFLADVNARLAGFGLALSGGAQTGAPAAAFTHPDLHLLVSCNDQPLAPAGFARALGSDFTRMKGTDYAARVAAHNANLFVTVGDGPGPAGPVLPCAIGGPPRPARLDRKVQVCFQAILALTTQARPDVVHWCQSDMLFTPEEIAAAEPLPFPVPLVTHPTPFTGPRSRSGPDRIGFRANQSQLFCDKMLVMEENPHPIDESLSVMDFLILRYMEGQIWLQDGDIYKLSDAEQIRVRHVPGPRAGLPGHVSIRLEPLGSPRSRPRSRPPEPAKRAPASPDRATARGKGRNAPPPPG